MDTTVKPYARRKVYFVQKDFQTRFILKFCLLLLAGVVLSTALLYFVSQDTLTSTFEHSRLVIQSTGQAILPAILYTNLITLGLITLAAIVVVLFVSHKIAGPLYRLEKEVQAVAAGDLSRKVTLRDKDQIVPMAEGLNHMIGSLHEKIGDIRQAVVQARQAAGDSGVCEEVVAPLNELLENIDRNFKL